MKRRMKGKLQASMRLTKKNASKEELQSELLSRIPILPPLEKSILNWWSDQPNLSQEK